MLRICPVKTDEDIESVKVLFIEYAHVLKKNLCEYADLPWLIRYYEDFEKETTNLPDRYGQPEGLLLLASYQEQMAGCVAMGKLSDEICEMKRLFVREEYRRKGIGTALCEVLIEHARRVGYTHMRLATALEPPKPLYKALGFKEITPFRDVPDEIRGVVYMELKLI
jgi:GNAT superfamily N-acetyltransferase